MLIFFILLGLITSISTNIFSFFLVKSLIYKNNVYEKWILEFKQDVINTLELIRAIDNQGTFASRVNDKGIFESDDQVGAVFKEIIDLIDKLNDRTK